MFIGFVAASLYNADIVSGPSFVGIVQTTGEVQVSGGTAVGGTTYTITPPAPFTSGNLCVLMSSNYLDSGTNGRISAVTFNGVAAAKAVEHNDGTFSEAIWYGYAGGGSAGCVVTLETGVGAGVLYYLANIVERDDAVLSLPLDTTNNATGTSTAPAVTIASVAQAHEFLCAVVGGENNATDTLTVPGDYVEAYVESDGSTQVPCAAAYKEINSTGGQTATFTYGASRNWQAIIAAFKLQTGGGGPPSNSPPTAAFTSSPAGLTITFTDTSTDSDGTVVAWAWDFGDGNTSTTQSPVHVYGSTDTYTISLTVTDDDGAIDEVSHSLFVTDGSSSTWDSGRKAAFVTLSGGNLTATIAGQGKVADTQSRDISTANHYFEITAGAIGQYLSAGMMRDDDTTYTGSLGQAFGELSIFNFLGFVYYADLNVGSTAALPGGTASGMGWTTGDVVTVLIRSGSVYFGTVASGWYDPTTSTFDADVNNVDPFFSGLTGNWAPAMSTGSGGATGAGTLKVTATFAGSVPSGASAWG